MREAKRKVQTHQWQRTSPHRGPFSHLRVYCGTGSKGDTHSVWGSRDGKEVGIVERRGGDSEADLRSEIASATPWTSANLQPSYLGATPRRSWRTFRYYFFNWWWWWWRRLWYAWSWNWSRKSLCQNILTWRSRKAKDDDVTIDTSSKSPGGSDSSTALSSTGEAGVIHLIVHRRFRLRGQRRRYILGRQCSPQRSPSLRSEGWRRDASSFAWTWTISVPGVGKEVSRGGCCCTAGELDTNDMIAVKSANRVRGDIEGAANAFEAVDYGAVLGTEGGGGMRCCSPTTIICMSRRAQIVKTKNIYTQLIRTPKPFSKRIPSPNIPGCSFNSSTIYRSPATACRGCIFWVTMSPPALQYSIYIYIVTKTLCVIKIGGVESMLPLPLLLGNTTYHLSN